MPSKNQYYFSRIHAPDNWEHQETRQAPDKLDTDNENISLIVKTMGSHEWKIKDLMAEFGLKDRENFMKLYIAPAVNEGYVRMLYPESPRHPRQRYLLTAKGLAAYNELQK